MTLYSLLQIIGKTECIQKVVDLVKKVAPTRATVLLQRERGTGKRLIAGAIQTHSPRAKQVFNLVNTASMPLATFETTLFGYVRSDLPRGVSPSKGIFQQTDHGTVLLQEIDEMGLETQVKLARFLEERQFVPIGGSEAIQVDVRMLAATNADLHKLVKEGKFREDLYYRLNVVTIHLPSLRERKEDIPLLCEYFFRKYCEQNHKPLRRFSPEAIRRLLDYDWPGNVRELENVVERTVVLSYGNDVGPELFLEQMHNPKRDRNVFGSMPTAEWPSLDEMVGQYEREIIIEVLDQTDGNQTEAAKRLHIPLSTLNQKIKRLNIGIKSKKKREAKQR